MLPTPAFILAATLAAPAREDVAMRFCNAVAGGRLRSFATFAASPGDLAGPRWERVRELVERHDLISVSSCTARREPDSQTVVVEIEATGVPRNSNPRRRAIPSVWYLSLNPAGDAVDGADDEIARAGQRLLQAATDDRRRAIADSSPELMPFVARSISDRDAATFLLQWSGAHGDAETEAYALCALARAAKREGHNDRAARFADTARTLALSASCDASAHADLVAAEVEQDGRRRRAFLERAAQAIDSLDDPRMSVQASITLLRDALEDFDVPRWHAILDRAESAARRLGLKEAEVSLLYERAKIAATINDRADAVRLATKVVAMAGDLTMTELEARAWAFLGAVATNPDDAVKSFENALRVLPPSSTPLQAYIHSHMGVALIMAGRTSEAAAHLEPALDAVRRSGAFDATTFWFGEVLRRAQGRYAEAMEFARDAIRANHNALWINWAVKGDLGQMLIECGEVERGVDTLREAIDLVEARRALTNSGPIMRAEHLASRAWIYGSLIDTLISQKRHGEALETAEQLRARVLIDLIGKRLHLQRTAEQLARERELNARVVELNRALAMSSAATEAGARRKLHEARAELESFVAELSVRSTRSTRAPAGETIDVLSGIPETTIVDYMVVREGVVAFVIRDRKIVFARRIAGSEAVDRAVARLASKIAQRDLDYKTDARRLYDLLIRPFAAFLPSRGRLTIIPDGFLWKLPFDALLAPGGRFVAQNHELAYAPSLAMLRGTPGPRHTAGARKTLLALGDPRTATAAPLPAAGQEARKLASLYGVERSKLLTGPAARESALKRLIGKYRIVHLATHGVVDDSSPLYSALLLGTAAADAEDGLFEMRELSDLDLNADLIVFSACDTGRGRDYPGEGVIGMAWAATAAGCPRSVVSQWDADSSATERLMVAFHRDLLDTEFRSFAGSLRRARLSLMNDPRYEHPYYWAPFILIGRD